METGSDTCVMLKMADGIGRDESPEQIESLEEQSGDKEVPDHEINGDIEEEPTKGNLQPTSGGSKKKKKKKKKGEVGSESSPESLSSSGVNLQSLRQLQNLQKSFELLRAGEAKAPQDDGGGFKEEISILGYSTSSQTRWVNFARFCINLFAAGLRVITFDLLFY